jgi:hypothetical protein
MSGRPPFCSSLYTLSSASIFCSSALASPLAVAAISPAAAPAWPGCPAQLPNAKLPGPAR